MKKLVLLSALLSLQLASLCQQLRNRYIQSPTFGVHFFMADFETALHMRRTSLGRTIRDKKFARIGDMSPGLALHYLKGLSGRSDLSVMLAGTFLDYPKLDSGTLGENSLLLEGDVSVRVKLFNTLRRVNPYVQAGAGISKYKGYWGAFIPAGVGAQVNVLSDVFLLVNAQYRFPATNGTVSPHFFYSIGITGIIGKKSSSRSGRAAPSLLPPPPPDRDSDGIADSADACPDVPGMVQYNGCADTDGDGIPDPEDRCVTAPGVLRYAGCPVPDTDGDGINDEADSCVEVRGVLRFHGCPAPDRDGDGVEDGEDKCPDLPGAAAGNGCPVVKEEVQQKVSLAAKHIFFATGSYELLPKSYAALDEVVQVMQEDARLKLQIEGHTDFVGDGEKNQLLSERRARAVLEYLVKKGVDAGRVSSAGYGEERPVADNGTAEGRRKNRRVEMRLGYE